MARTPRDDYQQRHADRRKAFLEAYEACGFLRHAAKAIGISHANHYVWLAGVPGYAAEFDEVHKRVVEKLGPRAEAELVSRAIEGVRTLKIHEGRPVEVWENEDGEIVPAPDDPANPGQLKRVLYWEVNKSDGLLLKLLKRLYPAQYAERQEIDHTSGGKPLYKALKGVTQDDL